jgi:glycosyltransferase involved in cell wall biosynthesis
MRILMLVLNQVGKGTYWRAFHLGRFLARKGHAVTLMATSRQKRLGIHVSQSHGITLVEAPDLFSGALRSGWDAWNVLNRINWLRKQSFDVIHAFESRPTVIYPALYLKNRLKIPLVMDWADWFGRGGSVEERPNPLVRATLRPVETFFEEHYRIRANRTTVICSLLERKAIALGVPPETIVNLPNGADIENLRVLDVQDARQQVGLPNDAFTVGYVGSIFQRDAALMAAAFDDLTERLPQTRLVIAGYCPLDLRPMVKKPDCIIQTGYLELPMLNAYLAASNVFWLPLSDSDANRGRFPLKFTDYLALGRPIVATRVGDVASVIEECRVGLISPPEAVPFAEQTMRLVNDEGLRMELGMASRHLAETRFNWDTITERLLAIYRSLPNINGG